MPVTLKEWTQDEWITGGISLLAKPGDYLQLSNLIPSVNRRQLQRLPAWSSQVRTDTNALTAIEGAFYDHANSRVVLIGGNATPDLTAAYLDASWSLSANQVLHATPTGLGGQSLQNVVYWGGYVYLIGSDGKVYRGTSYTAGLAEFDASTDHQILVPVDEDMYNIRDDGVIEKTSSDKSQFSTYYTPDHPINIIFFTAFRSYGLGIARHPQGFLDFYQINLAVSERYYNHITQLPVTGTLPAYGKLFTLHNDTLYFSPGYYNTPGGEIGLDIYSFNGSRISHEYKIIHAVNAGGSGFPASAGLISWRHNLIYYALEGTSQTFKILRGSTFVEFPSLAATAIATGIAVNVGGYLLTTADDTNEGIHYLQDAVMADAYLVTSRLDMGFPGKQKRLNRITVLLSAAATDFKIILKYRTDDTAAYTTAATVNGSQRASIDLTGVTFYALQLRIDLDDDSGTNANIKIDSISVTYTIAE